MGEANEQRRGVRVIALLAVLTAIEYLFAISIGSVPLLVALLAVVALLKAWQIVQYFMHISKLWRGEEGHS